jgi:uncharacterized protein YraI
MNFGKENEMKNQKLLLIVFMIIVLIMVSGCYGDQEVSQQVQTFVAGTMEAQNQVETKVAQMLTEGASEESPTGQPSVVMTATPTDSYSMTLTPTSTPSATPTLTATAAAATVSLEVTVPTNCRIGPGKAYDKVSVLWPGKTVKVIARDANAYFWVVENPEGDGNCWVWDKYATITGSTDDVPIWEAPPTPTPPTPTPAKVTLTVSVDTNCRSGPGKPYTIISILRIGTTAEVVGRNMEATFWVIQNPDGSGQCWVWGKYATTSGPAFGLPVLEIPPTPTPTSTKTP